MKEDRPRVSWLHRVAPFAAIGTTPAALMLGGGLAEQFPSSFLITLLVGASLVFTLTLAHAARAQRTGRIFVEVAAGVLGPNASRLASLLVTILMVGWYAFAVGVGGTALAQAASIPPFVGIILYSTAIAILSRTGIALWNWFALLGVAATMAFVVWSLSLLQPPVPSSSPLTLDSIPGLLVGSSMVLGYASGFALRSPDFASDLHSKGDVFKASLLGLSLPLIAFAVVGAVLSLGFGTWDLPLLLKTSGMPLLASLFLVVGFVASALTNLFSAELSVSHMTGLGRGRSFAAVFVAGSVTAALGFYQVMILWLVFLGIFVPPLVLTLIMGSLRGWEKAKRGPLLAWILGTGAGLAGWFLAPGYHIMLGLLPPLLILWPRS